MPKMQQNPRAPRRHGLRLGGYRAPGPCSWWGGQRLPSPISGLRLRPFGPYVLPDVDLRIHEGLAGAVRWSGLAPLLPDTPWSAQPATPQSRYTGLLTTGRWVTIVIGRLLHCCVVVAGRFTSHWPPTNYLLVWSVCVDHIRRSPIVDDWIDWRRHGPPGTSNISDMMQCILRYGLA